MHALKTGLNADEFVTFWMFPKSFICHFLDVSEKFLSLIRSANDP